MLSRSTVGATLLEMNIIVNSLAYRYLCLICAALIVLSTLSWSAAASSAFPAGSATAADAAAPAPLPTPLSPGMDGLHASAQPDTVPPAGGYFEEEEEGKNLYRDIGVFLIVSAFVGYFIIKVFLEGETEEPPPDDGGKEVPNPFAFKLTF